MNETMIAKKRAFVEIQLGGVMKSFVGFESIDYVYDERTGEEYVRIRDEAQGPLFIKVTSCNEGNIAKEVARVMLNQAPDGIVTDLAARKNIAPLFRKETN